MDSRRLEAFTDGVIAIIITIMVLNLEPPRSSDLASRAGKPARLAFITKIDPPHTTVLTSSVLTLANGRSKQSSPVDQTAV